MRNLHRKIKKAAHKGYRIVQDDGFSGLARRGSKYAYYKAYPDKKKVAMKDILFVNGCALPHPERYRVHHQIEQLASNGLTADSVFYEQLNHDMLRFYRGFVFFRCPVTDTVTKFIEAARYHNKACFFDVDDLVIDTKFTDSIDYVSRMTKSDRKLYDDGVNRMKATMQLCDYAITTTDRLQRELQSYVSEVFINRNVASDEMVRRSNEALDAHTPDESIVTIGYFSGSITHNQDFELVLPSLIKLMEKFQHIHLKIAGILDVPEPLATFADRVHVTGYGDWRDMPSELVRCDINLAPLVDSIFNEAKSENKWTEAALVKTVTLASNMGAFKEVIDDGETGILVDDDHWYEKLEYMVTHTDERLRIARNAHLKVLSDHTTVYAGNSLATFIRGKLARNIAIVLPSTDISGGVNVAVKHAEILRSNGWDVTLIDAVHEKALKKSSKAYNYRFDIPGHNVVTWTRTDATAWFDTMVATLWATLSIVKDYPNVRNRVYLVQGFETDFYPWGAGEARFMANATYGDETNIRYVTISLWCKEWLQSRFGKHARYASNGIELNNYTPTKRSFKGKIRVLVEGDSRSEYKNTDEAFKIVERLDPERFEISYLSYRREPKDWYRVDKFYNRIAPEKVGEVYAGCDILIKTSLVESFSYPPLEMMATGGLSVVVPNGGNVEYLKDNVNCLFYEQGNIDDGLSKVQSLVDDAALRNRLIKNGLKTANAYKWSAREADILALYQ